MMTIRRRCPSRRSGPSRSVWRADSMCMLATSLMRRPRRPEGGQQPDHSVVGDRGPRPFDVVVAFVLLPMGGWLLVGRRPTSLGRRFSLTGTTLVLIAAAVGCVGGIYGIGGGSILAPILIGSGRSRTKSLPPHWLPRFSRRSRASSPSSFLRRRATGQSIPTGPSVSPSG